MRWLYDLRAELAGRGRENHRRLGLAEPPIPRFEDLLDRPQVVLGLRRLQRLDEIAREVLSTRSRR